MTRASALVAVHHGHDQLGLQNLGDSEIQQLGCAVRRHQDVARFQVAMHDQVLMHILHRRAHLTEQA